MTKNFRKDRIIKARVTDAQGHKLDEILKKTGKSVSQWIRDRIERAK